MASPVLKDAQTSAKYSSGYNTINSASCQMAFKGHCGDLKASINVKIMQHNNKAKISNTFQDWCNSELFKIVTIWINPMKTVLFSFSTYIYLVAF